MHTYLLFESKKEWMWQWQPCQDKVRRSEASRNEEEEEIKIHAIRNKFWIIKITIITYSTVSFFELFDRWSGERTDGRLRVLGAGIVFIRFRARRRPRHTNTKSKEKIKLTKKISARSRINLDRSEKNSNHTENIIKWNRKIEEATKEWFEC